MRGDGQLREAPGWERRQIERQQRHLERMSVLEQIAAHLGGIADASKAPPNGDVLALQTAVIPASGVFQITWPGAMYQAVSIGNTSASTLTVIAGVATPSGTPPNNGPGQFQVASHVMRTVSLRGSALTVYGPAGAAFDFTAYSRPRSPSSGSC